MTHLPSCLKCRSATWLQLFIAWRNRSTRKGGHISMLKRCTCPLVHVKWDKDWQDTQFKCVHTHIQFAPIGQNKKKEAKLYKALAPFMFIFFLIVLSLVIFASCGWNCHSAIMWQSKLGPPPIRSREGSSSCKVPGPIIYQELLQWKPALSQGKAVISVRKQSCLLTLKSAALVNSLVMCWWLPFAALPIQLCLQCPRESTILHPDVLEACIRGVAEWAAFLTSESLV